MNLASPSWLAVQIRNRSRSMGLKLLLVSGLALVMLIPALFVGDIVEDRTNRAKDVVQGIGGRAGGQQTFLGPTLSIPYSIPALYKGASLTPGIYVVFPAKGDAVVKTRTQERHRSLFKVPVYQAELKFDATFDLTGVPSAAPAGAELDWTRAAIVIGASDARGALADGTLTAGGKMITFVPAESTGNPNARLPLAYFDAKLPDLIQPNTTFNVNVNLRFSGSAASNFGLWQKHPCHCRRRLAQSWFRRRLLAGKTHRLGAGLYLGVVGAFHRSRHSR